MIAENIKENIELIRDTIGKYKTCSGDVALLAVTKQVSPEKIRIAYDAGIRDFGENYLQEVLPKIKELSDLDIRWHYIGHLQSRKASKIAEHFYMVQSVDSFKVAEKLNKKALELNKKLKILLEIDFTEQENRSGFKKVFSQELEKISVLSGIELEGLMTVAPFFSDPEMARPYFRRLAEIKEELKEMYPLRFLSIGMTGDYKVALSEGANLIRIGSGIFGARAY